MRPKAILTRRSWMAAVGAAGAWSAGGPWSPLGAADPPARLRPKVAAVFTELRFRSHAYNILENFFAPYLFRGQLVEPGVEVVSFYADQFPEDDMAREVSRRFKVPLYPTIRAALCRGGGDLAVDAVLSIGEHGDYPVNELGQRQYPRKEFFDQAVAVMRKADRYVPFFNDKHLSYRWDWAKAMFDTARGHGMPMLAGSSVPLAERRPALDLPADSTIEEALAVHGGGLESYDFHGLELLQSFVEGRKGGETGVAKVELLAGEAAARAAEQGRWSRKLLEAALAAERTMEVRRGPRPNVARRKDQIKDEADNPERIGHVLLVTYRDGARGTVVQAGSNSNRWNFACRLLGEERPRATALFNSPWGNRGLFKALSHAIQHLFVEKKPPHPIERTLLTTGVLAAAMRSHQAEGKAIETPELEIAYPSGDWSKFRENGASWQRITADTPQPTTFEPGDGRVK